MPSPGELTRRVCLTDKNGTPIDTSTRLPVDAACSFVTPPQVKLVDSSGNALDSTISGQSAVKTFVYGQPDNHIAGAVCQLDGGNTTSTLLAAAAVYTGTWNEVMGLFSVVHVECIAQIPGYTSGVIEIQWSSDGVSFDGSFDTASVGSTGGNPYSRSFRVKDNYYRVVFTNGSTDMVAAGSPKYFRITSTLHPVGGGSIVSGNGQFIVGGDGSGTPGAPITLGGDDGAGSLLNLQCDASGNLKVVPSSATQVAMPVCGDVAQGSTDSATTRRANKIGSRFRTAPETVTNNQRVDVLVDNNGRQEVLQKASSLGVTATAAAGTGVTLTIPAAGAGIYHHITFLEILQYASVAQVGAAAPVVVTTTNLPGAHAFTFKTALPIGESERQVIQATTPIRSSVANTATTIVCPVVAGVIWRVNAIYYSSVQT